MVLPNQHRKGQNAHMKEPDLLIILDSNVLFRQHPMRSPNIKNVLYVMTLLDAYLQVPEVINDEYVNNYREQLLHAKECFQKACAEAKSLGLKLPYPSRKAVDRALYEALIGFQGLIRKEWGARRVRFHPYPQVDHQAVVARCLAGKRPFRSRCLDGTNREDKEKGYRDFLLWMTICEIYKSTLGKIAFVTNDFEGFWDKEKRGLHPHLLADLNGDSQGRVALFDSIEAFLKVYYFPNLERQKELERRIIDGFRGSIDFDAEISRSIESCLDDEYDERACTLQWLQVGKLRPKRVFLLRAGKCCIHGECWAKYEVTFDDKQLRAQYGPIKKRVKFEFDIHCDLDLKKSTQRGVSYNEEAISLPVQNELVDEG